MASKSVPLTNRDIQAAICDATRRRCLPECAAREAAIVPDILEPVKAAIDVIDLHSQDTFVPAYSEMTNGLKLRECPAT